MDVLSPTETNLTRPSKFYKLYLTVAPHPRAKSFVRTYCRHPPPVSWSYCPPFLPLPLGSIVNLSYIVRLYWPLLPHFSFFLYCRNIGFPLPIKNYFTIDSSNNSFEKIQWQLRREYIAINRYIFIFLLFSVDDQVIYIDMFKQK